MSTQSSDVVARSELTGNRSAPGSSLVVGKNDQKQSNSGDSHATDNSMSETAAETSEQEVHPADNRYGVDSTLIRHGSQPRTLKQAQNQAVKESAEAQGNAGGGVLLAKSASKVGDACGHGGIALVNGSEKDAKPVPALATSLTLIGLSFAVFSLFRSCLTR